MKRLVLFPVWRPLSWLREIICLVPLVIDRLDFTQRYLTPKLKPPFAILLFIPSIPPDPVPGFLWRIKHEDELNE